jgi:hypothetical protein
VEKFPFTTPSFSLDPLQRRQADPGGASQLTLAPAQM